MEGNAASDIVNGTGKIPTAKKATSVTGGAETLPLKRVVKLTAKALVGKLDSLQKERKNKLNTAGVIRKTIQCLMVNNDETEVKNALDKLCVMRLKSAMILC
ncbi:unnamed protein product [Arctogadus glacialis]